MSLHIASNLLVLFSLATTSSRRKYASGMSIYGVPVNRQQRGGVQPSSWSILVLGTPMAATKSITNLESNKVEANEDEVAVICHRLV